LARRGDITGAAAKFAEALRLDPSLKLEPEADAKHIIGEGRNLARQGDVAGAIARFREALALEPDLDIDPQREAASIAAPALVEQGRDLAQQGDVAGAVARFQEALALEPTIATNSIRAEDWNALCWYGATWNQAALVVDACDTAVNLAPEDGDIRDSRGLARALTGDVPGAIEDFEFAVQQAQETGYDQALIESRTDWIEALRAGTDPQEIFDAATLEGLR
jgi:tetratricopeptide (TPR) repeat protein